MKATPGDPSKLEGPRALRVLPFLALAVGLGHFVAASPRYALTRFPLDDAWIHGVYASSLARGGGFTYNPGSQEAGFTSPLWVIASAPAHWLSAFGTDAWVVGVKVVGVLLAAWVVWEATLLGRALAGAVGGVVAGTVVAMEPRLLFAALSGMESLLTVGLWLMTIRALWSGRWRLVGVGIALAPLTRPEMILLWPVAALAWLSLRDRGGLVRDLGRASLGLLPLAAWSLFCLAVNGHPLPNTYYVKSFSPIDDPLVGTGVALVYLGQHGWLAAVGAWLAAALCAWLLVRRERRVGTWLSLLLVGAPLLYALGVVFTRDLHPSGYYWTRWFDPPALVLTAAAAVGLGALVATAVEHWRAGRRARTSWRAYAIAVVTLVLVGTLAAQSGTLWASWQDRRGHLASDARAITELNEAAGLWLRENTANTDSVGVNDAGAIRYFGRRTTLDLVGLNAASIAVGRVGRAELLERWDPRWLAGFPIWLDDLVGRDALARYEPRVEFSIPPDEYTVCDCPSQTRLVIYERRATAGTEPNGQDR